MFSDAARFVSLFPNRISYQASSKPGAAPDLVIDASSLNTSRMDVGAIDFALNYSWTLPRWGRLELASLATRNTLFSTRMTNEAPSEGHVGVTYAAPPKYQINAGLFLKSPWLTLGWEARHVPSYIVSDDLDVQENQGATRVSRQQYHSLLARYTFQHDSRWLGPRGIELGVQNIFNKHAAFDANAPDFISPPALEPNRTAYLSIFAGAHK